MKNAPREFFIRTDRLNYSHATLLFCYYVWYIFGFAPYMWYSSRITFGESYVACFEEDARRWTTLILRGRFVTRNDVRIRTRSGMRNKPYTCDKTARHAMRFAALISNADQWKVMPCTFISGGSSPSGQFQYYGNTHVASPSAFIGRHFKMEMQANGDETERVTRELRKSTIRPGKVQPFSESTSLRHSIYSRLKVSLWEYVRCIDNLTISSRDVIRETKSPKSISMDGHVFTI